MYQKIMDYRNQHNRFSRFLGIKTTKIERDYAEGEVLLREDYQNTTQSIQGGLIYTLADSICGSAAFSRGKRAVTLNADFQYLRPARGTKRLFAVAQAVKAGRQVSVYNVDIFDEDKTLLAKGTFSFFHLDEDLFKEEEGAY
ncbi:MAG: PaaI family thioesterase [Tissierellia bacterium]|nr:PaaI family thioesterase [Tissierellia bacterium]